MSEGTEQPSKWIPMGNKVDLAHLGKLGEECGELSSIVSRCIIQGIDENDPETGKPNRIALMEEIADVMAMGIMAMKRFNLDFNQMVERRQRKIAMKSAWHEMIEE